MLRMIGLALLLAGTAAPALAADGRQIFQFQCKGCHGEASSPSAPTLHGVYGAKIAGRPDFTYSPGLVARTGEWNDASLDAFLTSPAAFAPGTRMPVALAKPEDRAAIIQFLKTLK